MEDGLSSAAISGFVGPPSPSQGADKESPHQPASVPTLTSPEFCKEQRTLQGGARRSEGKEMVVGHHQIGLGLATQSLVLSPHLMLRKHK